MFSKYTSWFSTVSGDFTRYVLDPASQYDYVMGLCDIDMMHFLLGDGQ